jgi:uncharacterized membrane protein
MAFLIYFVYGKKIKAGSLIGKDYIIERVKDFKNDPALHDYEKNFLSAILPGDRFSTKELKQDRVASQALYMEMKEVEKTLLIETEVDTKAFAKPISKQHYEQIGLVILFIASIYLFWWSNALANGFLTIGLVVVICAIALWLFIKFKARLNAEGEILKEEWLGFKLYLETAERYRLQNLTPETFEKYLPYAIIFGIEKKWGKAFDSLSLPPPNWYHGALVGSFAAGGGSPSGFSTSFSASAFSASFASSFTSAFSSSGGAGASGGGGGAGGGGGGGGGGAS